MRDFATGTALSVVAILVAVGQCALATCIPSPYQWDCYSSGPYETVATLAQKFHVYSSDIFDHNPRVLAGLSPTTSIPTGTSLRIPILMVCEDDSPLYMCSDANGEAWCDIAAQHNIPCDTLKGWNAEAIRNRSNIVDQGIRLRVPTDFLCLDSYVSGAELLLPYMGICHAGYTTLPVIAAQTGFSEKTLLELNSDRLSQNLSSTAIIQGAVKLPYCNDRYAGSMICYKAQINDTLPSIAARFGISEEALCNWNNCTYFTPIDTFLRIAANPEQHATASCSENAPYWTCYTVEQGDTITTIAQQFGLTPERLCRYNVMSLGNCSLLDIGFKLRTPLDGICNPQDGVWYCMTLTPEMNSFALVRDVTFIPQHALFWWNPLLQIDYNDQEISVGQSLMIPLFPCQQPPCFRPQSTAYANIVGPQLNFNYETFLRFNLHRVWPSGGAVMLSNYTYIVPRLCTPNLPPRLAFGAPSRSVDDDAHYFCYKTRFGDTLDDLSSEFDVPVDTLCHFEEQPLSPGTAKNCSFLLTNDAYLYIPLMN